IDTTSFLGLLHSASDKSSSLSPSQQKLLKLHNRMGHVSMSTLQQFAREGLFGSHLTSLGKCENPLCCACIHGKQHRPPYHPTVYSGHDRCFTSTAWRLSFW
ncbi:MAG: GAG-pre-integrase domain-containing protein, partial [bacterium]